MDEHSAEETTSTAGILVRSSDIAFQHHTTIKQEEEEDTEDCRLEERRMEEYRAEERRAEERCAKERRLWLTD